MRRGRIFFILAFVLILGVVAVLLVWRLFLSKPSAEPANVTPTPPPVEIVYVTQNVSKGTTLEDDMLATMSWPQDSILPGMFESTEMEKVTGRMAKYDMSAGMPVMDSLLLKDNETLPTSGSPWALSIPPTYVAVSLPISRLTSVSYAPRPGDHVSVIMTAMFVDVDPDFQSSTPNFTGIAVSAGPPDPESKEQNPLTAGIVSLDQRGEPDPATNKQEGVNALSPGVYGKVVIDPVLGQAVYLVPGEEQRPRFVSHMLLTDVAVLQVGDFPLTGPASSDTSDATPTPTPEDTGGGEGQEPQAPVLPGTITLLVRPQDAVTLAYLMHGQSQAAVSFTLALRGINDTTREITLPVTLQFVLEQYQIPVPARLPYSLNPRIDSLMLP